MPSVKVIVKRPGIAPTLNVYEGGKGVKASARPENDAPRVVEQPKVAPRLRAETTRIDLQLAQPTPTPLPTCPDASMVRSDIKKRAILAVAGALFLVLAAFRLIGLNSPARHELGLIPKDESAWSLFGKKIPIEGISVPESKRNPKIPLWELFLCTGRNTPILCSGKTYHPFTTWWEEWGKSPLLSNENANIFVGQVESTFYEPPKPYESLTLGAARNEPPSNGN